MFILSGKFKNHTRRRVGFPLSPCCVGERLGKYGKLDSDYSLQKQLKLG
jgi:hypothetical protein